MFSKKKKQNNFDQYLFLRRKQLLLPVKIMTLLNFFEIIITEDKNKENLFKENWELFDICLEHQNSYKNKTKQQQFLYYQNCLSFLEQETKQKNNSNFNNFDYKPSNLQFRTFHKTYSKLISKWQQKKIKIDILQKQIYILSLKSPKHNFKVRLENYYIRQSQDNSKKALVLETIVSNSQYPIIRLAFQNHNYQQAKNILTHICWKSQINRFCQQIKNKFNSIHKEDSSQFVSKKSVEQRSQSKEILQKKNTYVSKQIINEFEKFCQKFINQNPLQNNYKIIVSQSHRKIYENNDIFILEQLFFLNKQTINNLLLLPKQKWNKSIKQFLVVQKLQNNIQVIYERFNLNQQDFYTYYLRRYNTNKTISKGISDQNYICKQFQLVYESIQVHSLAETVSKLIIQLKINTEKKREFAIQYLKQFSNLNEIQIQQYLPIHNVEVSVDMKEEEQFYSIINQYNQIQVFQRFGNTQKTIEQLQDQEQQQQKKQNQSKQLTYLNYKHQLECNIGGNGNKITNHYLFQDWRRLKSGGVLCINQKIVNQQKKIGKYILSTIGKNILKSKNILNISLPVSIFKKQSHIQSIARNFSFAPLLIQKAKNLLPVQRLKFIITFTVTIAALGVSMEKPFNPVVGETYQGKINECLIFLQQISHHPPISAYYFVGRGYKAYGQINSKIDLRLNSVQGYSDRQNLIVFDNGDTITYSVLKMVINGLLFGDRQFNFEDKSYIYDVTNNLFAQLSFDKKNVKDFFSGKILKVNPNFQNYFHENSRKKYPQNGHIIQQICQFEGIWCDYISFNGIKFFDFKTELPYEMEDQKFSLPSDSTHRLDIKKLIQQKVQQSQNYKQRIQEQQRRYQKLRQNKKNLCKQ